jgi:hypothetical protein
MGCGCLGEYLRATSYKNGGFYSPFDGKYYAKLNGLTPQPLSLYTLYFNLRTQTK